MYIPPRVCYNTNKDEFKNGDTQELTEVVRVVARVDN